MTSAVTNTGSVFGRCFNSLCLFSVKQFFPICPNLSLLEEHSQYHKISITLRFTTFFSLNPQPGPPNFANKPAKDKYDAMLPKNCLKLLLQAAKAAFECESLILHPACAERNASGQSCTCACGHGIVSCPWWEYPVFIRHLQSASNLPFYCKLQHGTTANLRCSRTSRSPFPTMLHPAPLSTLFVCLLPQPNHLL